MGRMSRSGRRTFCRCSSAGLVVRVVAVLLISLLATVGRDARMIDLIQYYYDISNKTIVDRWW